MDGSACVDVVVVGGGIVGAACAYYLCTAGLDVCLVERDFPASGASRSCDGLLLLCDKAPGPELALAQASLAAWAALAEELDCEYVQRGSIVVVENAESLEGNRRKAAALAAADVRCEELDNAGLRAVEPNLAPDLAGGFLYLDEAQVNPMRATVALLGAARRRGLQLRCGAEVTALRRAADGRVTGVVAGGAEIAAGAVVCAAGVWSEAVARTVGQALPVRPRKGHVLVTARAPGLIRRPLIEGSYAASVQSAAVGVQVALVAELTLSGTMLLGSSREFVGYDRAVSPAVIQAIAARAVRFIPGLAWVSVIRSYTGLRPWSPDHLPLIGPVEGLPGFYLATGHEGAGIGLAPITGQIVTDWVTEGVVSPVAAAVRPARFQV